MAIFHASTKPIARSAGRSSVAAAAYRTGCELVDERTGLVHDYTKKGGVVSTEIITPDGLSAERNALWNAAEAAEKRKDARTAREWVVALPSELNHEQRKELAHTFGVKLVERFGVAADIAIHKPDREGDNRNHHAHILTTTRQVGRDEAGKLVMGEKATIELSDKARRDRGLMNAADEITAVRELWEQIANRALEQAGRSERIDHRSLKAQGIDREATTHLGPTATEMERRGVTSDRGDGNRQAQANNQEREQIKAQIIDLQTERLHREQDAKRQAEQAEINEFVMRSRPPKNQEPRHQVEKPATETPTKPIEAQKAQLPIPEQIRQFNELKKSLTAQRLKKAARVEAKAETRYKRRNEAFYATNTQRLNHEFNPPRGILGMFKQKEHETKLVDLMKVESVWQKLREQAGKILMSLRKYTKPDMYGSSPCEKWAEAKARRLQPSVAMLADRQEELDREAKKQKMLEQQRQKKELRQQGKNRKR